MSDSDKPAFPQHHGIQCDGPPTDWHGMTLRDWFAGQAMAAIIAKIPFQEFPADWLPYEKTAIGAYDYADAMLEARKDKP